MSDFPITIFHNPACGTSRNALEMIRAAGYAPTVVDYVQAGWTLPQLETLLAAMAATPRDILRTKGTPAEAMGLMQPGVADKALLDAMLQEPLLVNRPIVVTPLGVKLCRPSEAVFELLARKPATFTKEDGEVIATDA